MRKLHFITQKDEYVQGIKVSNQITLSSNGMYS